ncbi:D-alanyl-D-alanine dipeptidase [Candidatus Uabimicrobium sp. HlEnr_7]|uniref:D-alanyl-D-alanine dipeptidase n=1 Tax=Candidatus Uabimicrobium helgolandensis TaxID=3095367 RepID=UPI0035563B2D
MRITLFIVVLIASAYAQKQPTIIKKQNDKIQLVDVCQLDKTILLDIRYATTNNITKTQIYKVARCLLARDAAYALVRVNKKLKEKGLVIKIYDGYRPHSCQKLLWKVLPDSRYVANPKNGSRHNRGCAVDLTLCDLKTGKELKMPTGFDDFSKKAHRDNPDLPQEEKNNSELLREVMEAEGFSPIRTEWWHFDYKGWRDYPLLDIPLEKVQLKTKVKINIKMKN